MSAHTTLSERIRWTAAVVATVIDDHRASRETLVAATDALEDSAWRHVSSPMTLLQRRLGLSPIEIDALWILASCELEPQLARVLRSASSGDSGALDVALLQRAVSIACDADIDDSMIASLANRGLVETAATPELPTYQRPIRASDRVLLLARGVFELDPEVASFATLRDHDELAARRHTIPSSLLAGFGQHAALVVHGMAGSGRRTLLAALASRTSRSVLEVSLRRMTNDASVERLLRAALREAQLFCAIPLFVDVEGQHVHGIDRFLSAQSEAILVTSSVPLAFPSRATVNHEIAAPSPSERRSIWSSHLNGAPSRLLDEVADSYAVSPATIVAAASSTLAAVDGDPSRVSFEAVHAGLRAAMDQRLTTLATRITVSQTWDDLVLPSEQQDQLLELIGRVRHRSQVLDAWGFADKVGRGVGVSALLSGPPGTGKTMVAGLLALELGLDIYQVDLSRVVSKFIGETEKNLGLLFDAAESGHAILLFDEADALFAKRSEVKSSNDRHANQEVNYLLQRMERFRGITLLTTNHERALDAALQRRLSMHIRFAAPDVEHREKLWKAMIPSLAPLDHDIDFSALARGFAMAGGYIRNAVIRAAYVAAHEGTAISGRHLARAARAEYEAIGRLTHAIRA